MARFRKVEVAVWGDERFQALSPARPNGQTLWLYLLTGPRTTTFPGLVVARDQVMASDLGWELGPFREAFREASGKGMAKADWKAGLVVLRKALIDSTGEPRDTAKPESPNVIRSWAKSWDEVPECSLKAEYLLNLESFSKALGEAFHKAFREAFRKALAKASPHPSPNQEQEKEQEQEQESLCAATPAPGLARLHDKVDAATRRQRKPPTPGHAEARDHWFAYWSRRTGQRPTWAAKHATLLNGLIGAHGPDEVRRRIDLLEASRDNWIRGWDFAAFASHSDRLVSGASLNGPRDLRAGDLLELQLQRVAASEAAEREGVSE